LREAIGVYLDLVATPPADETARLMALARALDLVAFAFWSLPEGASGEDDPEPPRFKYDELVRRNFPELDWYPRVDPIDEVIKEPTPLMADAADDVADIAGDLATGAWLWDNASPASGAWYLKLMHFHWDEHLRGVSLYLGAKLSG
jgi:hypothetical protein